MGWGHLGHPLFICYGTWQLLLCVLSSSPSRASAPVGCWGVLGSRAHTGLCRVCVCVMGGGSGERRVFIGVHTCPVGGRRKGLCAWSSAQQDQGGSISPVPALPQGCLAGAGLPRKAPFQIVPHTPHPGPADSGVLLLCSRAAVERSWEELPAHPSHTDLAFMKSLKQQIIPGTCVGVKDGLSKIPATPACPCSSWHPQNHPWAGPKAALSQTPESPWSHCNVPICQPGPRHSWTGVGVQLDS